MLKTWKANGNEKTIKHIVLTAIFTFLIYYFGGQAVGMFKWQADFDAKLTRHDTDIALMKQDTANAKELVKKIDEKIEKIYQYIMDNGKKK